MDIVVITSFFTFLLLGAFDIRHDMFSWQCVMIVDDSSCLFAKRSSQAAINNTNTFLSHLFVSTRKWRHQLEDCNSSRRCSYSNQIIETTKQFHGCDSITSALETHTDGHRCQTGVWLIGPLALFIYIYLYFLTFDFFSYNTLTFNFRVKLKQTQQEAEL